MKMFLQGWLYYSHFQQLAPEPGPWYSERKRKTERQTQIGLSSKVIASILKTFNLSIIIEDHIENKKAVLLLNS